MNRVMVRYKVKPEQAARNEELVQKVYAELHQTTPAGLHYAAFVLDDGVSFVHLASHQDPNRTNPLLDNAAFGVFQKGIAERCDEPPARTEIREVGSYRFWGD